MSRSLSPQVVMSALRHHFQSFLVGGVTALSFGYYVVHQDVWKASERVEDRVAALGRETVSANAALQQRVQALEDELRRMKTKASAE